MSKPPGSPLIASRELYERFVYTVGEARIETEERLGLTPTQEEIPEYTAEDPSEVGAIPARIALGILASAAAVTILKLKGLA